jgi:uncharacterized damage-inducible protein DinB
MEGKLLQDLYEFHRWANRRLFAVAASLGEDAARAEVGRQFSFPTLKGMFAHVYAADAAWLARWNGEPVGRLAGDQDFADLATLRAEWDGVEEAQRRFVAGLSPVDLERVVEYTSTLFPGRRLRVTLGPLLQHVVNHATHHRSEIATMLTMVSGSPPPTDLHVFHLLVSGQLEG